MSFPPPRLDPRSAASSSASSPQTNPNRTNNERDRKALSSNEYESFERAGAEASSSASVSNAERAAKQADKIRQVTQNFFRRAALTIVNSRVNLAPSFNPDTNQPRSSKWFQLVMDESDELAEVVDPWVYVDAKDVRPPPMIVEIYLDTGDLTRNQTLVVVDERGKKWDVCEAMKAPANSSGARSRRERSPQIVLERWRIHLDEQSGGASGSNEPMANVYKKAVIMFRSLFSYSRFLPAWKLARSIAKEPATLMALRPMYRVFKEGQFPATKDTLTASFYPSAEPTCQTYKFAPVRSPAGSFNIEVMYRRNCNFRVADYEALVSSYYMGMDEPGEPSSLGDDGGNQGDLQYHVEGHPIGSLPVSRKWATDRQELNQAYGSLSTFHHAGHGTGTSPISALRAARESQMESAEPQSPPLKPAPTHRASQSSKSSLKSNDSQMPPPTQRRVSVSFQPFKAGSLASSPGQMGLLSQSPGTSVPRTSVLGEGSGLTQARNRTSLTALPQTTLRIPPSAPSPENVPGSPGSASPKAPPMNRYSSSFGHRRSRMSSGGGSGSRADEDIGGGNRSGNSSKRGSALLTEGDIANIVGSGSSGSVQTDDDNISDFLSLLEQKKDLKSFNRTDDASRDASGRRTASALNRYRGLRESNAALTESMTSSVMMRHSSGSSSQRLSGGPPMLAGASVSTSSSPGKPISPHTPHTPAIPSRLSEQATIRDHSRTRGQSDRNTSSSSPSNEDSSDSTSHGPSSGAIPIPTSPSRFPHHARRSSSAHQRNRAGMVDLDMFDIRPASLPVDEKAELTLSELVQLQQEGDLEARHAGGGDNGNTAYRHHPSRGQRMSQDSTSTTSGTSSRIGGDPTSPGAAAGPSQGTTTLPIRGGRTQAGPSSTLSPPRPRLTRRGSGSAGSTTTSGSLRGSTSRFSFNSRPNPVSNPALSTGGGSVDDDEPLLFTMSELGRKSLENMDAGASSSSGGKGKEHRSGRDAGGRSGNEKW